MPNRDLKHYKKRLKREREEITGLLRAYDKSLDVAQRDSVEELSSYDNHPADLGTETFARGLDIAVRDRLNDVLTEIDRAEERLAHGTYGMCQVCGRRIEDERLEAIPYTTVCAGCQAAVDEGQRAPKRPAEEDLASPPFDRTFLDEDDSVVYDGEDAWQAVEAYGTSSTPSELDEAVDHEQPFEDAREPRGFVEDVEELAATDRDRSHRYVIRRKRKT